MIQSPTLQYIKEMWVKFDENINYSLDKQSTLTDKMIQPPLTKYSQYFVKQLFTFITSVKHLW